MSADTKDDNAGSDAGRPLASIQPTRRELLKNGGLLVGAGLVGPGVFLAACSPRTGGSAAHKAGGTLRIAQIEEVTNFDPAKISTQDIGVLVNNVYEGLFAVDRDTTNVIGRLAQKWDISPDGKTITLNLRPNVKFHDGSVFDAEAVRFSIERLQTINKGPAQYMKGVTVEVVDKLTVKLHIPARPRIAFKALVLIMMVSPTAIKAQDQGGDLGQKWLQTHSAGTGPYKLTSVIPGQMQTYTRFDDYWRGWHDGQATEVQYLVQLDQSVVRLMLERGDLDLAPLKNTDDYNTLKNSKDLNVYTKDYLAPNYMMMNTQVKPLDDLRVRQAIQHAWNRAAWRTQNGGSVAEQLAPAPKELLGKEYKPITYPYSIEEAKSLLAQAGYSNGFKITHWFITGDTHKQAMAELLQQELAKLNIQMGIQSVVAARMFERIADFGKTKNPASAMDMITIFTPAKFFDLHNWLDWHFNSKAWTYGRNFMFYSNSEVDTWLSDAAEKLTDAEALPLYKKVADQVAKDAGAIMIEAVRGYVYTRKNISGFYFDLLMWSATVNFYDIRMS